MKIASSFLLFFAFTACSQMPLKKHSLLPPQTTNNSENVRIYKKAYRYLEAKNYKAAALLYETLNQKQLNINMDLAVKFNTGSSYEGLNNCKKAMFYYQQIIKKARKKAHQKIRAQALLRLSYAYECLGKDNKTLAALLLAFKQRRYLNPTVVKTEIPARLGAAYTRLNNKKLSKKFFGAAEKGLAQIRNIKLNNKEQQVQLARALYFMGKINTSYFSYQKIDPYVNSSAQLQKYLIQSIELDPNLWGKKAAINLINYYKINLSKLINWPKNDKLIKRRFSIKNLTGIQNLKKSQFNHIDPSPLTKKVLKKINSINKEFKKFLKQSTPKL